MSNIMLAIRGLARAPRHIPNASRAFSSTTRHHISVGDELPDIELFENSPGNKVSIVQAIGKKGLIVGVPAAFSPSCSASHVPGYINAKNLKNAGSVIVVSVNDPFVMKAWQENLDPGAKSGIRFLADPHAAFTNAADLAFDSIAIFGNARSKRYALTVEDGKVTQIYVEPDNTGVNVSAADKVLA